MRRFWLLALLTCSLLALGACIWGFDEPPGFTRNQALAFFHEHQAGFTDAAQAWLTHHAEDSFHLSQRKSSQFYWNTTGLACSGATCRVRTGDGHETAALPFAQAAERAGVQADDLRHWIAVAQTLKLDGVSVIGAGLPVNQRYLELKMCGSARMTYGFLYIPDGHCGAEQRLKQAQSGFTYLQPLDAHWTYFEASS